LTVGYWLKHTR